MSKDIRKRTSDAQEEYLAKRFGARRTRGSGNRFNNPMDVREDHLREEFAFAMEGKATLGAGITVTTSMWRKAVTQSHGERPMVVLTFFDSERLDPERAIHLGVIDLDDFDELRERARV